MRRMRVSVLVAALTGLLVAALVGPGAVTAAAPTAPILPTAWRWVTVPAAAFHASDDAFKYSYGMDYKNTGTVLIVYGTYHDEGEFLAPLFFDSPFVVQKMVIYATDKNPEEDVCVTLYRAPAGSRTPQEMGHVCSHGSSGTYHRFFAQTVFSRPNAGTGYGIYLEVDLPRDMSEVGWTLTFEGVKIAYTLGT